ncbi:MAG: AI-2E family transporter [Elusimicrobia bacterium]|nr:AI-2E family transporter [Elusimicrobiota bacterium]
MKALPPQPDPSRLRWYLAGAAVLAAVVVAGWVLFESLFPVFLGFALAYAFDPLADRLEGRGLSRTVSVSVIMTAAVGGMIAVAAVILPTVSSQARELASQLPDYLHLAAQRASAQAAQWGIPFPQTEHEMAGRLKGWLRGMSLGALLPLGRFLTRFFSSAAGMLVGALNLVVVPVVFFYFLRDISEIRGSFIGLFPPRWQACVVHRLDDADRVLSGYIRGQISVALILAALYSIGLALVGIPFGVVIGILSGLLNIVPYVGVLTGLVLSLVMAAVDFGGVWPFLGIFLVFGVCQLLEGFIITPKIVGDKVGLSTVETVIALIIGGELGGFLGLIAAIPAAGILKVYGADALTAYRESSFYRADPSAPPHQGQGRGC